MKSTGIIRHIDDLGRLVIPREIRRVLNFREGDPLELFIADDMLCLQKYYAENSYKERVKSLIAGLTEDSCVGNAEEIKSKLNEVLELLGGKENSDE